MSEHRSAAEERSFRGTAPRSPGRPPKAVAQLVGTYHCRPWRFGSADYLRALSALAPVVAELPVLLGPRWPQAGWDEQLTTELARAGRAIHEELVLNALIADLV